MEHTIVEDFLDTHDFVLLHDSILRNTNFPWFTNVGVSDYDDLSDKYFCHYLYENSSPNSNFFGLIEPILQKIQARALVRAKVNLYTKSTELIVHGKHTDFPYEHKGFIFYLNTNDGYTELEDGTKVMSVANRALFFDAGKLHNSTNCTDQLYRANISINYF